MAIFQTIVFHVGPPKTGSSFLQNQLLQAAEPLAEAGWAVPGRFLLANHGFPNSNQAWLIKSIVSRPVQARERITEDALEAIPRLFRQWLSNAVGPGLILSWEGFAGFSADEWLIIKDYLSDFIDERTSIRFIYFVRDPLRGYLSNRNQWMKQGVEMGIPPINSLPEPYDPFRAMRSVWGASASFETHRYETASSVGLWSYFCELLDVNPDALGLPEAKTRVNSSISLESLWILSHCVPKSAEEKRLMRQVMVLPGSKDGLTRDEAEEIWAKRGHAINAWMKSQGLPAYAFDPPILSLNSADLWPDSFLEAWFEAAKAWNEDEQEFFKRAFQKLGNARRVAQWHPAAVQRFARLYESVCGESMVSAFRAKARLSRPDKWRFVARLIRSVIQDAVSGSLKWSATEQRLQSLQFDNEAIWAVERAMRFTTPEVKPKKDNRRARSRFGEDDWHIPPRAEWDDDPFRAERFPDLELLAFHIVKTGGSSFRSSIEASRFGPFCSLSHLHFRKLREEIRALPEEDRGLAFANAIASGLPRDTKGIQGHILLKPWLVPFLLKRHDVLKIIWMRSPESWAYSRYAFIRQQMMKRAPAGWRYPEMEESIFRDIVDGCNQPKMKNAQSRAINRVSLDSFDFVGITEHFEEDLAQIDALLNHPGLKPVKANTSKKPRPLTPEEIAAIREYHSEDVAIYERALALRAQRTPPTPNT